MINDGLGLCVKLCEGKNGYALFMNCKKDGDDVVVDKDNPEPYIVAMQDNYSTTSWCWGHYFATLRDAMDYLYKDE